MNIKRNYVNWASIYNQNDRLYLDWDIHYQCNFSCSYCFQKFDGKLGTKVSNISKNINYMLSLLKRHKLDFTLGLLGGEPTLKEEEYFRILDYFQERIFPKKEASEIYVSTNLSKDMDFYKRHKTYRNVYQWVSIHPEYHLNDNNFFKKLILLKDKSPDQFILSPMLSNKALQTPVIIKFYEKIYSFFLDYNDTENIIYSPQFIFEKGFVDNNNQGIDLSNPIFNNSIQEFQLNNKVFTLNEFLQNPISFNQSKCQYNYYNISPELDCNGSCINTSFNIKDNPIKFLNLKPKEIICEKKICLDYPMLLSGKT